MYRIQAREHFDAAHYIKDYAGKCSQMHGHRWSIEVCLQGRLLDNTNMLVDFGDIKGSLKDLIDQYCDHKVLNETMKEENVTAEFLAEWFYDKLNVEYKAVLVRTCVWESPDCCAKYSPEEMRSLR